MSENHQPVMVAKPDDNLAYRAMLFARRVHASQCRRYTSKPNIDRDRLAEVAGLVASAQTYDPEIDWDSQMIAVAWLHDTMAEHGVGIETLQDEFGLDIARGVWLLSDFEKYSHDQNKGFIKRVRLAEAPGWVQTIKCAIMISDASAIVRDKPKLAPVYLNEIIAMLDVLEHADLGLRRLAREIAMAGLAA